VHPLDRIEVIQMNVPLSNSSCTSDAKANEEKPGRATESAINQTIPYGRNQKRGGSASQFWLHDEDRHMVRKLAAWLELQRERPTDSLVIRSALQIATCGPHFLQAYRRAIQMDGRLKEQKAPPGNLVPLLTVRNPAS
jgi:hypothetical protein